MKTFRNDMRELVSIVQRSGNCDIAYKHVNRVINSDQRLLIKLEYRNMKGFKQNFKSFYNDVKKGNYSFESEITYLKQIGIKSFLTNKIPTYQ